MSHQQRGEPVPVCSDSRFDLELINESYPCGDHYCGYAYRRHIPSSSSNNGGGADPKVVAIKDGFGKYTFANGSYYDGDWKQGFMSGSGTFYEGDTGDSFDGTWDKSRRVQGVYRFSNGDVYVGAFDAERGALKVGPAIVLEDRKLFSAIYDNDVPTTKRPLSFSEKASWDQVMRTSMGGGGGSPQHGSSSPTRQPSPRPTSATRGGSGGGGGGGHQYYQDADANSPQPNAAAHTNTTRAASPPQSREEDADAKHFVNQGGMSPERLDPHEAMEAAKVVLRMKREKAAQRMQQRNPFTRDTSNSISMGRNPSSVPSSMQPQRRATPDLYRPTRPRALSTTSTTINEQMAASVPRRSPSSGGARRSSLSPGGRPMPSSPVRPRVSREPRSGALDNQSFGALQRGQVEDFFSGPSTKELDVIYRFYR